VTASKSESDTRNRLIIARGRRPAVEKGCEGRKAKSKKTPAIKRREGHRLGARQAWGAPRKCVGVREVGVYRCLGKGKVSRPHGAVATIAGLRCSPIPCHTKPRVGQSPCRRHRSRTLHAQQC